MIRTINYQRIATIALAASIALLVLLTRATSTEAFGSYRTAINNAGYSVSCGSCHTNASNPGSRNAMGQAFEAIPTYDSNPVGAWRQIAGPPPTTPTPVPPTATPTRIPPTATPTTVPPTVIPTTVPPTATPTGIPPVTPTAVPTTTPAPVGTNLALNKPVTVSSTDIPGNEGAKAVDGNTTTRWSSAYSDSQWIRVDLGSRYNINKVVLNWETAYGKAYQIQLSDDGNNWQNIYTQTNGTGGVESLTVAGTGRYLRLNGVTRATQWGYSLWELQAFGNPVQSAPITNLALNKPVTTSSTDMTGHEGVKAVDGSTTTRWSSAYANNQWINVDLGAQYNINKVVLNWETAYGKAYQIQVSNDGANWQTIFNQANGVGGTESLNVAGTGRYVRMYGLTRGTQWGFSLWDLQVLGTPAGALSQNLAVNKPVQVSSVDMTGHEGAKAVDGSTTTRWSSAYANNQWINVDLGAQYNINKVVLNWETAYGKAYQIQVSNDGANWQTIFNQANGVGGTESLNVAGTGRYVRMFGLTRGTQWGFSLWDLQVLGTPAS